MGGGDILRPARVDQGQLRRLQVLFGVQHFDIGAQADLLFGLDAVGGDLGGLDLGLVRRRRRAGGQHLRPRLGDRSRDLAAGDVDLGLLRVLVFQRFPQARGVQARGVERDRQAHAGGGVAVMLVGMVRRRDLAGRSRQRHLRPEGRTRLADAGVSGHGGVLRRLQIGIAAFGRGQGRVEIDRQAGQVRFGIERGRRLADDLDVGGAVGVELRLGRGQRRFGLRQAGLGLGDVGARQLPGFELRLGLVELLFQDVVIVLRNLQRFLVAAHRGVDADDVEQDGFLGRTQAFLARLDRGVGGAERRGQVARGEDRLAQRQAAAQRVRHTAEQRRHVAVIVGQAGIDRRSQLRTRLDVAFVGGALLGAGTRQGRVLRIGGGDGVAEALGPGRTGQPAPDGQRQHRSGRQRPRIQSDHVTSHVSGPGCRRLAPALKAVSN